MSENGVCLIKPEFLVTEHVREVDLECVSEKDKQKIKSEQQDGLDNQGAVSENTEVPEDPAPDEAGSEPPQKVARLSKKKLRGQNKSRPAPFKFPREKELCYILKDVAENEEKPKCTNPKCVFLHDVVEYLKIKPKDVGDVCYNFETTGRCPRGLTCRFGAKHITSDGYNIVDKDKYFAFKNKKPSTVNSLNYDLVISLRKRKYDFSLSQNIIDKDDKFRNKNQKADSNVNDTEKQVNTDIEKEVTSEKNNTTEDVSEKTSGTVTDEDIIKIRKSEKKTIDWKDKLYLSPLTTVGNLPFRRICKEYGVDITCGEMAMCTSLLRTMSQEWALVKRHETEDIFGVQLCGNNPHIVAKTAQMLQENTEIDFIDLNLGCPIDLVFKEGAGSGLLRRQNVLGCIVRSTSEVLNIPFTVKTRTGVYSNQNIAHTLVPKFKDWGASMITLHGRSKEQRYTKNADWDYINECAALAAPIPLFGNGDILSYEDYLNVKENYKNVSGVMIGRGALIKPWIFTEIKEQRLWDISSSERFDILKKYTNYGLEHWGSDTKGVENTRRFMLEWLSFLYRYVPVGVLERPPQKINERPPAFRGRDDMETLMASGSCSDWIKISEMLLGPVPENFHFLPKHKANSYK